MMGYSCKQAMRIASDALERPLSPRERWLLRLHLFICRDCRHGADQFRMLHEVARGLGGSEALHLSEERRAGIRAELQRLAGS
ncbi:MAG: zf-HC2 domain-containing protein [Mariprofundaceae bacterium]